MSALYVRGWLASLLAVGLLIVVTSNTCTAQAVDELAALNAQVAKLHDEGEYVRATEIAKQALELAEKRWGAEHPEVSASLNSLAGLYQDQKRYAEAEPLYKRELAISEKALGPDHSHVDKLLNNMAGLYQRQVRYTEAEQLYKRILAVREKVLGPDHPFVGSTLYNLGGLYMEQARYVDAVPLMKRSLALFEKQFGPESPYVGRVLTELGVLYDRLGRYAEAEPLMKRSLALFEKVEGPDHPSVGTSLSNLVGLYIVQGRYAEAEPLMKRSQALFEKEFGPDHPVVASALSNLAAVYRRQKRYAEAEPLMKRSLALREKALSPDHPDVGDSLNNLGVLYFVERRYAEAEPLMKRSLALREKALGSDHPVVGHSLSNLAAMYLEQGDWERSADFGRRSVGITVRRMQREPANVGARSTSKGISEADQVGHRFSNLVKVMYRLASPQLGTDIPAEMFVMAQWAKGSEAAASLVQMAARGARGDPGLSSILRERQDLLMGWQKHDEARDAAASRAPNKRDTKAEAVNTARLTEIDTHIAAIDKRLAVEFSDYAALASPKPLTALQVQANLRPDEALVLFLDTPKQDPTPEETFVWVVTKTEMRLVRSDLGTPALAQEVAALRCGLDATNWSDPSHWPEGTPSDKRKKVAQAAIRKRCVYLTSANYTEADKEAGRPLPFDAARAHKLYKALFGKVEDLTNAKNLLLVPSGPLTQLPFQVLVTKPPTGADYQSFAWLARDHALTVLPAVSSLEALRRTAKPTAATLPMIGFGNPLLDGPDAIYAASAALARAKQQCPDTMTEIISTPASLRRGGIEPVDTRDNVVAAATIRQAPPLPETADELCAVARDLEADVREMRLGARATERELKAMSASGALARYRIVHFATHGTLAGNVAGSSQPGLLLTPPKDSSEEDDGYLSASEIMGLKLDADLVILSACSTAGGAGVEGDGEALSGLARAFFYAQARAVLVSHWEVDSAATVKLITSAVRSIARDKAVGRAEGLRRAMLAMIDYGAPHERHPAYWAPFIVVGEGAATQ